jgi:phosphopantetheine--protein transferase-like protein
MARSDELRFLVGTMLMLPPDSLGSDTSLRSLDTSLGGARLALGLKRLGLVPRFRRVPSTFGELESSLNAGSEAAAVDPSTHIVENYVSKTTQTAEIEIGLDIQDVQLLPVCADYWDHEFYRGCFSRVEIAYAIVQSEPRAHFAGFWSAKEALKKCDARFLKADLTLLTVLHDPAGKPYFIEHHPDKIVRLPHSISISHSGTIASAVVAFPKR